MNEYNIQTEHYNYPSSLLSSWCDVRRPGEMMPGDSVNILQYKGVWDTGAGFTTISSTIINKLNLQPCGEVAVNTIHGTERAKLFKIDLVLPFGAAVPNVLAIEGNPSRCDVLIGLNVISQGNFAISYIAESNLIEILFRMPSGG